MPQLNLTAQECAHILYLLDENYLAGEHKGNRNAWWAAHRSIEDKIREYIGAEKKDQLTACGK